MTQPTDWLEQAKREIAQELKGLWYEYSKALPERHVANEIHPVVAHPYEWKLWQALIAERARNLELRERQSAELGDDPIRFVAGEDETGALSIFWLNPWSGEKEVICRLFWPTHPPIETSKVEEFCEELMRKFADITVWNPWKKVVSHERD